MKPIRVLWRKVYFEEFGEQDQNGLYDYIYRYYIYEFILPAIGALGVRRYVDTPDKCSFQNIKYVKRSKKSFYTGDNFPYNIEYLSSIIIFLKSEEILEFSYLSNTGYLKIDESKLTNSQIELEEFKT